MLNEKLKELRENIGLSQADVADLMFCSRSLIAKWEQGRANPSDNDLKSLSDIYKCSYEELLKETKNIDVSSFSFTIKSPFKYYSYSFSYLFFPYIFSMILVFLLYGAIGTIIGILSSHDVHNDMKYFIAICTCILLLCSFNSTNKGGIIRECPPEVISSISMLSDDTNSYRQLSTEKRYDAPNVKLSEVNLLCFTLRTPMFTKTSKPLSTIKVLCHYRILLPEQKFNSLYPSINYVKSSCKYFIYTLGHILI